MGLELAPLVHLHLHQLSVFNGFFHCFIFSLILFLKFRCLAWWGLTLKPPLSLFHLTPGFSLNFFFCLINFISPGERGTSTSCLFCPLLFAVTIDGSVHTLRRGQETCLGETRKTLILGQALRCATEAERSCPGIQGPGPGGSTTGPVSCNWQRRSGRPRWRLYLPGSGTMVSEKASGAQAGPSHSHPYHIIFGVDEGAIFAVKVFHPIYIHLGSLPLVFPIKPAQSIGPGASKWH